MSRSVRMQARARPQTPAPFPSAAAIRPCFFKSTSFHVVPGQIIPTTPPTSPPTAPSTMAPNSAFCSAVIAKEYSSPTCSSSPPADQLGRPRRLQRRGQSPRYATRPIPRGWPTSIFSISSKRTPTNDLPPTERTTRWSGSISSMTKVPLVSCAWSRILVPTFNESKVCACAFVQRKQRTSTHSRPRIAFMTLPAQSFTASSAWPSNHRKGAIFRWAPAAHFSECRPIMVPSVSTTRAMKPYSPIGILPRCTCPPCATARAASTAQSAQLK